MQEYCWAWRPETFENLDKPHIAAGFSSGAWLVTVNEEALSWGYSIDMPEGAHAHILWRASLEVRSETGKISPGLAFHDFKQGMLFQVNRPEKTAELRLVNVNVETMRTDLYNVSRLKLPYRITLEYNAITAKCTGAIDGNTVFALELPHRGIPALFAISALEIVATTQQGGAGGTVGYGTLRLNCE